MAIIMKLTFCFLSYAMLSNASQIESSSIQTNVSQTNTLNLYRFLKALSRGNEPSGPSLSNIFSNVFSGLMNRETKAGGIKRGESFGSSVDSSSGILSRSPTAPSSTQSSSREEQRLFRLCILGKCQLFSKPTQTTQRQCFPRECGRNRYPISSYPDVSGSILTPSLKKIVGGSRARTFAYPWTVMLAKKEGEIQYHCGAAIICQRWIVTNAHCLDKQSVESSIPDLNPDFYTIYVGRHVGWNRKFGRQVQAFTGRKDILSLTQHENYNPGMSRGVIVNDIALIHLRKSIQFNQYVKPVCLPQAPPRVGEMVWATGWGDTKGVGPDNSALKEVSLNIHNDSVCKKLVVGYNESERPELLCAGGVLKEDTCGGDSGGPLVGLKQNVQEGPRYQLYGLTNLGSESCNTESYDLQPSLYINITNFLPWIKLRTNHCCEN